MSTNVTCPPPEISSAFQDLEWRQRFRLSHGSNHPQNSLYRITRTPLTVSRNRYGTLQPWDHNRVRLRQAPGGSDYVNASTIVLPSPANANASQATSSSEHGRSNGDQGAISNISSSFAGVHNPSPDQPESRYIATQGPKQDQSLHFWQMVMQETVGSIGVIIMLTTCYEGNKEKCGQYFPQSMLSPVLKLSEDGESSQDNPPGEIIRAGMVANNEGELFLISDLKRTAGADVEPDISQNNKQQQRTNAQRVGNSELILEDEQELPACPPNINTVTLLSLNYDSELGCEIRHLRAQLHSEEKQVYHYLFNGWPDFGKPDQETLEALLRLTTESRDVAANKGGGGWQNPRFVHCSAGVGRTGTFIAIDWLLHELEAGRLLEDQGHTRGGQIEQGNREALAANQAIDQNPERSQDHPQQQKQEQEQETWGKSGLPKQIKTPPLSSTTIHPLNERLTPHPPQSPPSQQQLPASSSSPSPSRAQGSGGLSPSSPPGGADREHHSDDLIYETVNALREQRPFMVMNELQYAFVYDVLKAEFVRMYRQQEIGAMVTGEATVGRDDGNEGGRERERAVKVPRVDVTSPTATGVAGVGSGAAAATANAKDGPAGGDATPSDGTLQDISFYAGTSIGNIRRDEEDTASHAGEPESEAETEIMDSSPDLLARVDGGKEEDAEDGGKRTEEMSAEKGGKMMDEQ